MVIVTIIGVIILFIDIILLYYSRDEDENKVLQAWMILLAIIIAPVPVLGLLIGGILLIVIISLFICGMICLPYDLKLFKWLTKKI